MAPSYAETNWQEISELYRTLEATQPTVVVRVNRAIAEAEVYGPEDELILLDDVDSNWHYLWVARSDLQHRLGQTEGASRSLHRALAAEMNDSDRALLEQRLAELDARG